MSNKSKSSKNKKRVSGLEKYLTTPVLAITGLIFLMVGAFFTFSTGDSNPILDLIKSLLTPSNEDVVLTNTDFSLSKFLLFYLPGIILLCISIYGGINKNKGGAIIALISVIYFLFLPLFYYISLFLGNIQFITPIYVWVYMSSYILLFISSYIHKKNTLFLFSIVSFYIALLMLGNMMSISFVWLFIFAVVFYAFVSYLVLKLEKPGLVVFNSILAFAYFAFFLLRKFIVNSKIEYVVLYLVFTLLIYILIYFTTIYASNLKEKSLGKKSQLFLIVSNFLFFLISTSFVLIKYYGFNYLWAFVFALLVFNVIGLIIINKNKLSDWLFPYYAIIILLASLVLPLLIQQNILFLFSLIFAVFMLIYARINQNKLSFWVAVGSLIVSLILFFKLWVTTFLLSMYALGLMPDFNILWSGIITGLVLILSLAAIKAQTKSISDLVKFKWFMPVYKQVLYSVFLVAIFLTLVWAVFALQYIVTATVNLASVSILIGGSLFFIAYLWYYKGRSSSHKKSAQYMAFGFVLLYPVLIGWSLLQQYIINLGNLDLTAVIMHYIAIALVLVLGTMSVIRMYKRNGKFLIVQNLVQFIAFIYLAYLVCTEYDTLYLVIMALSQSHDPNFVLNIGLVEYNKYLPYTVLLWVLSIVEFLYGVYYHKPFLRMCALYLFIILLIKLFLFDFEMISAQARSAVFFGLGIFLIVFALVYPKLKAATARSKKLRSVEEDV